MTSIISQVNSQSIAGVGLPQMRPAYSFDKSNFYNLISAMHPKPIDTSAGQRAWINSLGNLAGFLSPYLVGWLKQATGSNASGMYMLTGFLVLGALLALSVPARMVNR